MAKVRCPVCLSGSIDRAGWGREAATYCTAGCEVSEAMVTTALRRVEYREQTVGQLDNLYRLKAEEARLAAKVLADDLEGAAIDGDMVHPEFTINHISRLLGELADVRAALADARFAERAAS